MKAPRFKIALISLAGLGILCLIRYISRKASKQLGSIQAWKMPQQAARHPAYGKQAEIETRVSGREIRNVQEGGMTDMSIDNHEVTRVEIVASSTDNVTVRGIDPDLDGSIRF